MPRERGIFLRQGVSSSCLDRLETTIVSFVTWVLIDCAKMEIFPTGKQGLLLHLLVENPGRKKVPNRSGALRLFGVVLSSRSGSPTSDGPEIGEMDEDVTGADRHHYGQSRSLSGRVRSGYELNDHSKRCQDQPTQSRREIEGDPARSIPVRFSEEPPLHGEPIMSAQASIRSHRQNNERRDEQGGDDEAHPEFIRTFGRSGKCMDYSAVCRPADLGQCVTNASSPDGHG